MPFDVAAVLSRILAWIGSPRALGAVVIAALIAFALKAFAPLAPIWNDPFWRWVLVALVVSSGGLLSHLIGYVCGRLGSARAKKSTDQALIARLNKLDLNEQNVLGEYLQKDARALPWGRFVGIVDTLARDGVLQLISSDTAVDNLNPDVYAINEVAWKHLHEHPELVSLKPNPRAIQQRFGRY